ncbi:uncharacterized protein [Lepisosteus oculatus]|uniref:uncharacterized protein n=1 Tax=Lepisosteus oculatus TaxID=7918 RepID=UPI0037143614
MTLDDTKKDSKTILSRTNACRSVTSSFNASFPDRCSSSMTNLKSLWKRLKIEAHNAMTQQCALRSSGRPVTPLTQLYAEIRSIVVNLAEVEGAIDSDGIGINTQGAVRDLGSEDRAHSKGAQEERENTLFQEKIKVLKSKQKAHHAKEMYYVKNIEKN